MAGDSPASVPEAAITRTVAIVMAALVVALVAWPLLSGVASSTEVTVTIEALAGVLS